MVRDPVCWEHSIAQGEKHSCKGESFKMKRFNACGRRQNFPPQAWLCLLHLCKYVLVCKCVLVCKHVCACVLCVTILYIHVEIHMYDLIGLDSFPEVGAALSYLEKHFSQLQRQSSPLSRPFQGSPVNPLFSTAEWQYEPHSADSRAGVTDTGNSAVVLESQALAGSFRRVIHESMGGERGQS